MDQIHRAVERLRADMNRADISGAIEQLQTTMRMAGIHELGPQLRSALAELAPAISTPLQNTLTRAFAEYRIPTATPIPLISLPEPPGASSRWDSVEDYLPDDIEPAPSPAEEVIQAINEDLEAEREKNERPPLRTIHLIVSLLNGEQINVCHMRSEGGQCVLIEGTNVKTHEQRTIKTGASSFQYEFLAIDHPPDLRFVD